MALIWRAFYRCAWLIALPLAFVYLWRRGRRQPAYRQNWGERLGRYPVKPSKPVIWLHAVSVGETRAAVPLIDALIERHPDHQILLTQMTPTGRETAQQLLGDRVLTAYLPYDLPFAVRRFLRHFQPRFGVLMEMELWPNLIHMSKQAGVPLYLINARLSERSMRGYLKAGGLIRPMMAELTAVAAQWEQDAERLRAVGAIAPRVLGNIKFDFELDGEQVARGQAWRQSFGDRPVWMAASTREGEEALLLDALATRTLPGNPLWLLVPRHPQRFNDVAALLTERKLKFVRRSEWDGVSPLPTDMQVLLGDSMGEMVSYYATADVVVMGGSLLDFGCQSVIEPCALGVPTLVGPSTFNFADVVREAKAVDAVRQFDDVAAVLDGLVRLLGDPAGRQAMGDAGREFVARQRGALQRTLEMLP